MNRTRVRIRRQVAVAVGLPVTLWSALRSLSYSPCMETHLRPAQPDGKQIFLN